MSTMFEPITFEQVVAGLEDKGYAIGIVNPEDYHRWKGDFSLPCVSKSALHEFEQSPYAYKWRRDHAEPFDSAGFRLGSAVDAAVTEPALFEMSYIAEKVDGRTKEGKARKAEIEAAGLINLSPDEMELVQMCRDNVTAHLATLGLEYGKTWQPQVAMWALLTEFDGVELATPVILTGMIDICPTDAGKPLYDLKTTSKPVTSVTALDYAMTDYQYGLQAAIYADLFELCTGYARAFSFLFVETAKPAQTRVRSMSREVLEVYRVQYRAAIRRFALACASGDFGTAALPEVPFTPQRADWEKMAKAERGEA